jgi:hypothetical protein
MLLFWMIDSRVLFVVWRVVLFDILVRFFPALASGAFRLLRLLYLYT